MFDRKIYRSDMINCVLCYDAPCSKACEKVDPAKLLRSIWFDNEKVAAAQLTAEAAGTNPCAGCPAPCEDFCVKPHQVAVKNIMTRLYEEVRPELEVEAPAEEEKLRTELCGVPLENPFLLSSSVVGSTYDMCARAFEAGWAGVSFKTICAMEIHEASPRFSAITGDNGSIIGFKNIEQLSDHSVEENMEIFRRLKENYPSKFILASIMGENDEDWERLARLCEENGADAIELNFSCPNMAEGGLGSDIGQVPELVERFTAAARRGAKIPILAKLTPNVDRMSPAAEAARRGGADGISAINTIKSIIGVNPHTYVSAPAVRGMSAVGGYSGSAVKPIALRFIAEMGHDPALSGMHLSGMGGVETWRDALEFMMMGAGSIQVTTAVMQYGYRIIEDLKAGLNLYLTEKGFKSVRDVVGIGLDSVSDTTDILERDTIVYPRFNMKKCIGCGRCMISCADGGHQAISMVSGGAEAARRPRMDAKKCVGCHLCVLVCPQKAITSSGKRVQKK
ncbi:MAG TPA: NAD-dependent dihydropyrimidine dehydrogenase subunit PreA [Lachnospiraceae bacterium]|nr:NAD-dependent dihydropyrimidine dehydrogenase subunit PreA [Lachnospiraceae bacterium]